MSEINEIKEPSIKKRGIFYTSFDSRESFVLHLSMLFMGCCGLAYEYTLSKISSDLLGNSVQQWAIVIGVMMFFMGVGADIQKHFSDKGLVDKFLIAEIILGILGGFGPILLVYSYGRASEYYILIQYLLICSIGLLIGFEIPLLTRINERYLSELKVNIGGILKMDYIGSLVGAILWVFIMPRFFTLAQSSFILGIINILVALVSLAFFQRHVLYKKTIGISVLLVLAGLTAGYFYSNLWMNYSEQHLYKDRIIMSETSKYQHVILTRSSAGDIACYINGNIQFNSFDESIYHENLVHPAFQLSPSHERVLILGGGDGLALREVLKYPGVKDVTLCDIDPLMTELASDNVHFLELNRGSLNDARVKVLENNALREGGKTTLFVQDRKSIRPRFDSSAEVSVVHMDAAVFLEQIEGMYDIIIIDFPDPNNIELSKLYATSFYRNLSKKLKVTGIMVQQSTSVVYSKEAFLCIGRTINASGLAAIPYHDNIPSFGEWGFWIGGRAPFHSEESLKEGVSRIEALEIETDYLTPELIQGSFHFPGKWLESENGKINTIMNNEVYLLYEAAWKRFL